MVARSADVEGAEMRQPDSVCRMMLVALSIDSEPAFSPAAVRAVCIVFIIPSTSGVVSSGNVIDSFTGEKHYEVRSASAARTAAVA